MKKIILFCVFLIGGLSSSLAGDLGAGPRLIFEENKNQWPAQVRYEADFTGGKVFFEKNTFTYLLIEKTDLHELHHKSDEAYKINYHAFKVNFENSNSRSSVEGKNPYSFHRNYYLGNDPSHWASGVKLYETIEYKNIYPNVDVKIYNQDVNLKYDIVVNPGGNPTEIKMKYQGADKLFLKDGNLCIKTSLGTMIEQAPYCYQVVDGKEQKIRCSFLVEDSSVGFKIDDNYNADIPLVIDPVLVASTYTGSFADNWGFTATYDAAGNIYSAGIAASAGYPTTLGAFDNTFNGGMPWTYTSYPFDISITKYNSAGTAILFSTYYGGSKNEQPHSLIVNANNELYVAGRTNSTNFPTTTGAYDVTQNGGYDIIVGKFNSSGALLASTFVGGTGDDGVNINAAESILGSLKFNYADDGRSEIILDNNSNVYIAGSTRSTDFPATPGAYDATLGGSQDGCLLKMNSALSALTFCTYIGGSADDAAYGIKLSNNKVFVTGGTASADFPTTAGVLHPSYMGGAADGFIAAFNSTATSLVSSTFMGTSAYDQSYLIETDANSDIYVYGQTKGAYPVTPGVYSNPNSGQFIHKLNNQLSTTVFSTVIGSGTPNPNISPTAFLVDSCQSIYIAGWGRCAYAFNNPSPSTVIGMPITPNAFQSTTDGCDFYFMVLRPNAQSLLYATYFGENSSIGDHVDGGTSRFDRRGFIYQSVCASCGGYDGFPTTSTAWSRTNNSFNCNNAVIKMDLRVSATAVASLNGSPAGCAPYTVTFNNTGSIGTGFKWNFGDGSAQSTSQTPSHTYTNPGTYVAKLYVADSTGTCGNLDSTSVTITVGSPPTIQASSTPVFCNGGNTGTATVVATGSNSPFTYHWSNGQTNAVAAGLVAGTYTVTSTNSLGCTSAPATVTVTQPNPLATNATFTNVGCNGGANGTATATVSGGTGPYTYTWLPGGYSTNSVSGLGIGTYTVTVHDTKGCAATATANITQPTALDITPTVTNAHCTQSDGSVTVTGSGGFAPYTWTWSNGQTGSTVSGLAAGSYTVTIHDVNLCTYSIPVSVTNIAGPTASITGANVSCNGLHNGSATITTSGGALPFTYLWNNGQTTPTASNLAAGIYSVVATDANNCSASASITITEPLLLVANAVGTPPSCNGSANGSAQASALGGTAPYSYLWAIQGNPTTATVSNLSAGTYNVTVTDAAGCIKQTSVAINNPPAVNIGIAVSPVLCAGDCNGSLTATVTNGAAPYTYSWNDSQHQVTASANYLCSGSYSVTVTDAHGCAGNAAAFVGMPNVLGATRLAKANVTCNGLCNGFFQIAANGGTPPYTYNWLPGGQTIANVTGLCAGTYTCNITDAHGCVYNFIDSIQEPDPFLGSVNVLRIPCNGECNGEINAIYSGGTPPYTYLWQPGLQTASHATTFCAGTNTVIITDSLGCVDSGSIVLTSPTALTGTVSTTSSNCGQANGSACIVVAGGTPTYKYAWSSGATDTLSCDSALVPGTYTITVKDGMGCILTMGASISDITGPSVSIASSVNPECYGYNDGTATTIVSGGVTPYTYLWMPGGQTIQNPNTLAAGINSIAVTDNAGCVGAASLTITTPPEVVSAITGIQHISCFGVCDGAANVLYGGGTAPLSLIWDSPGAPTTASISGLCADIYKVTITDGNNCVRVDSVLINQPPQLVIQNGNAINIHCFGDNDGAISALVSGGTPLYGFSWVPNISSGATATNLTAGTYALTVTDAKSCSASQSWTIIEPAPLAISSGTTPAYCYFANGTASAFASGGTTPYIYQWNDTSLQTTAVANSLASGDYICIVRDSNNCVVSDTVFVAIAPGPSIDSVSSTDVLCFGGISGTATVHLNTTVGTSPYTYLWSPSSQTAAHAINLQHGAYSVLVTDSAGCAVTGVVVVEEPSLLTLSVSPPDTVCYRDTAQVYAQAVGGTPNYLYSWSGAGAGLSGTGPHIVLPDSNSTYTVIVSDAHGCSAGPLDIFVLVPPPLALTITPGIAVCDGDSALLTAMVTGGDGDPYLYSWSNGASTQSVTVYPTLASSPESFDVTATDGCSQPVTDTTIVTVNSNPTGSYIQNDTSGCSPLTITFSASSPDAGASFSWDFDDASTDTGAVVTHTFTNDTSYYVSMIITSAQGCSVSITGAAAILVDPSPVADFSIDPSPASSIYPFVNFMDLSTTPIVSWLWDFNDPGSSSDTSHIKNPSHTYSNIGTFSPQLIVTNQYGCKDTIIKPVIVIDDFVFYAPNTFTPNEDDFNEIFLPVGVGWDIGTYELYIFDRWGELIFETKDYKQGWNGKANGGKELAKNDVYVWKVKLKDLRGNPHKYIGHVTLLK